MALTKESEENVQQLQLIEHNLQNLLQQRQQFQAQLLEIDSASNELKTAKQAYKIIGNIMISTDAEALRKETEQKKETLLIRVRSIEKREEELKEKAKELQEKVLKALEK